MTRLFSSRMPRLAWPARVAVCGISLARAVEELETRAPARRGCRSEALTLQRIEFSCSTKADRILEMGFDRAIEGIVGVCPANRQTLFLSATLDGVAADLAVRYNAATNRHQTAPGRASRPPSGQSTMMRTY
jgi:hypothetical protein